MKNEESPPGLEELEITFFMSEVCYCGGWG